MNYKHLNMPWFTMTTGDDDRDWGLEIMQRRFRTKKRKSRVKVMRLIQM
jgi:hypothetical protein